MGGCSTLFHQPGNENTISARSRLSDKQIEQARAARDNLLRFVKPQLTEALDIQVKHWIQGSLKNHTLIRPPSVFEEFDIDVGLYLIAESDCQGVDALSVKKQLRSSITDFAEHEKSAKVHDEIKHRCERVVFDNHFHIDLPLYWFDGSNDTVMLATESGWEASDPKGFQDWFDKEIDDLIRPSARRMIRYLKAWASLKARRNSGKALSSMAISILVARYLECIGSNNDEIDFIGVAKAIVNDILETRRVDNPLTGKDILGFSATDFTAWRDYLIELERCCEQAENTNDSLLSYHIWAEVFEHVLPPINETGFGIGRSGLPALTTPALIQVSHYDGKMQLITKTDEQSLFAYKKESLDFTISNMDAYPPGAVANWVVRNQGQESADSNDIGHSHGGDSLSVKVSRGCAYAGVHYMEVTVSVNGQVQGVGQVKVTIRPYPRPVRTPVRKKIFRGF